MQVSEYFENLKDASCRMKTKLYTLQICEEKSVKTRTITGEGEEENGKKDVVTQRHEAKE